MVTPLSQVIDRYSLSSHGFGSRLREIYAGLAETPLAPETTHRFFAAPHGRAADGASPQDRLLHLMGRSPAGAGRA